jgi:hypothetical protein
MTKLWILCLGAAALGSAGLTAQASVVTLNWNDVTQGTLTKSGPAYTELVPVGGGDVKVSVQGSTSTTLEKFGAGSIQTPAVTSTIFNGGLPASESSNLSTVADFHPSAVDSDPTVTFTINFLGYAHGVSDVTFSLFDVDANDATHFVDRVTFLTPGVGLTGSADNVISGPSGNVVTGTHGSPNTGPGSGDGNVLVKYGTLPSNQITFVFDNPSGKEALHGIGIGNISFTPVPEASQLAMGLAACALGAFWLRKTGQRRAAGIA